MRAFGKNILFKAVFKERSSKVLLLDAEKPVYHEVVSRGSKTEEISIGDKCILKDHYICTVKYEGDDYLFTTEEAIWAKIND
jgi:co-chaperonin GroES (HSP10)